MSIRDIRERVNIFFYDYRDRVLLIFKILSVLVSISAILVLGYFHGFPHTEADKESLLKFIQWSFGFYIVYYIVRVLFHFHPKQFFRETMFEGIMMSILLIEGFVYTFWDTLLLQELFSWLGFKSWGALSTLFIQAYFLFVVFIELSRTGGILPKVKFNPATIFIFSFFLIISAGTVLLMLPEMTTAISGMSFIDAMFTSTSATCVTGLMVENPDFFTFKGQVVLLILMKLGGLNIIAFGSFLFLAARLGVGIKQHDVIEDFVNHDSHISARGMLRRVILWSLFIEFAGALAMHLMWTHEVGFASRGERFFYSIFHSVSAFNNAGITLFENGLANTIVAENYYIHWIITILVFFGALGMMAMFDIFSPKKLRERMKSPWKTVSFSTKIALYFSIALVVIGSVLFFITEYNNTLEGMSFFGAFTTSVFQSVSRTSGFNSVDIGAVCIPMLFVMCILMFIGSSSSSTGGGIKTSTFAIISANVLSTIKGHKHTELFKRTVSNVLISRAFSVLLIFIVGNVIGIFLLCITESEILAQSNRTFMDLVFEEISAFGTVGLSTGITPELTTAGKVIIATSMFVGRVGTLTVAFAFGSKLISKNYKYPEGHTMVG